MSYRIGSFNMKNLSLNTGTKRDLRKIADIIVGEGFDVVALQEVLSEGAAINARNYTKKTLLMELGPDWDFAWADTELDSSDRLSAAEKRDKRGEGFGFLWNTKRLRLAKAELDENKERIFYPRITKINKEALVRHPYYGRFTPSGTPGGPFFEIRLICIHTYFGESDNAYFRQLRQNELNVLMTDVYPQIADRVYKTSMPSYTILLGDYNVELWRPGKREAHIAACTSTPAYLQADKDDIIETTKWGGSKRIKTVQDEFTTLKKVSETDNTSEAQSEGYAHDYDHFSYEVSRFEGVSMNVKKIDAVKEYCDDDFVAYSKTISDHVPIMMEIELK